jgi:flagellar M-ring protein FliF
VPGTQSNVSGFASAGATSSSSYKRQEVTTNYETGRTVQHSSSTPGTLKRLSVAVVVDGPENEAQAQSISSIVSAGLGLIPSRGDVITVTSMPFDKSYYEAEKKAMEAAEQQDLYRKLAMIGGGIVGMAIIVFFLRRRFRGVASTPRPRPRARVPMQPALAPAMPIYEEAPAESLPEPFVMKKRQRSKEEMEQEFLQKELAKAARTEPKAVADLIEEWLKEE